MKRKPSLSLMVLLLMFPQIVETIYSPALSSLASAFMVTESQAAQTLSIYFVCFAFGVVTWGIVADKLGRRVTMLIGLVIYALSTVIAYLATSFELVMFARAMSAFGIAVGSVVTQTMLRDAFSGEELAKVFSLMGMGIAISPTIGMFAGGQLTFIGGYKSVFAALFVLALLLVLLATFKLPETQQHRSPIKIGQLVCQMAGDRAIWKSALLVAIFNIALFSYYQLGPFAFKAIGLTSREFGYSGVVLGVATLFGSYVNRYMLGCNIRSERLILIAAVLLLLGAMGVTALMDNVWFLLPMTFVVMAFGIAIPNILSSALSHYKAYAGSAGAVFGLMYYLMIGAGLAISGASHHLGMVLLVCGLLAALITATSIKTNQ